MIHAGRGTSCTHVGGKLVHFQHLPCPHRCDLQDTWNDGSALPPALKDYCLGATASDANACTKTTFAGASFEMPWVPSPCNGAAPAYVMCSKAI